jgi:hypothetical protein
LPAPLLPVPPARLFSSADPGGRRVPLSLTKTRVNRLPVLFLFPVLFDLADGAAAAARGVLSTLLNAGKSRGWYR